MKRTVLLTLVLPCVAVLATQAQPELYPGVDLDALNAGAAYVVTERGLNHRWWECPVYSLNSSGDVMVSTNSYLELCSGLHYLDENGKWAESQEVIEGYPGGAVARHGQIKVIFANNLATAGSVDMAVGNLRLRMHPLLISYFDTASEKSVALAEVTDCQGKLIASNQVLYENAFSGDVTNCSIRYTYTRGGFEQDVIFSADGLPPLPEAYGLSSDSTVMQVLTEVLDSPQAVVAATAVPVGNGSLTDEAIDFGPLQVVPGKGITLGTSGPSSEMRIYRQWRKLEGRDFLIEQVPVPKVIQALEALPQEGASLNSSAPRARHVASATRRLPARPPAKADTKPMEMASARLPERGLLWDFYTVVSTNNFTFRADLTHYVSGAVNLSGTTTCEGGTVIKFAPTNSAAIVLNGALTCLGSMFRPCIFTGRDDNTVGESIQGSSGNPYTNYYANPMLKLGYYATNLACFRFSYASNAVELNDVRDYTLSHSQFVNCYRAFNDTADDSVTVTLRNVLFGNVPKLLNSAANYIVFSGAHITMDRVTNSYATHTFTNTLFVGTSGFSGGIGNVYATTDAGVFQTVGAASYYLADNSPYRNVGTTNISASLRKELMLRTTYPPIVITNNFTTDTVLTPQAQRDTDLPDIGYMYDPIDWVVSGRSVSANVTLTNGVVLATYGPSFSYGLSLGSGSLVSEGSPGPGLNWIVRYNTVQEQSNTNWSSTTAAAHVKMSSSATPVKARFTGWAQLGGSGDHFYDSGSASAARSFTHCSFGSGRFYGGSACLTNCLCERVYLSLWDDQDYAQFQLFNNLLFGGTLYYKARGSYPALNAYDNLFDGTKITRGTSSEYFVANYNGYVTNNNHLPTGGNDVTLTNYPVYLTGPLGRTYYPTNDGMLSTLIDAGSRSCTNAGLCHFTVKAIANSKEATESNPATVDIGFHLPATDANGNLLDYDQDGIPDVLEDINGDYSDVGDPTSWINYNSPNGLGSGNGLQVFTPLH